MKRLLIAGAIVAAALAPGAPAHAVACVDGAVYSTFLGAGFTCTIGDKTFSKFSYSSRGQGGVPAIASSGITVDTIGPAGSGATILGPNIGFQFSAGWSVGSGQILDSLIGFTVSVTPPTGGVSIEDAGLVQSGTSFLTPGVAQVAENLSNLSNLVTIFDAATTRLSDEVAFSLTGSLGVTKDISVNGNVGGAASISLVQDT